MAGWTFAPQHLFVFPVWRYRRRWDFSRLAEAGEGASVPENDRQASQQHRSGDQESGLQGSRTGLRGRFGVGFRQGIHSGPQRSRVRRINRIDLKNIK